MERAPLIFALLLAFVAAGLGLAAPGPQSAGLGGHAEFGSVAYAQCAQGNPSVTQPTPHDPGERAPVPGVRVLPGWSDFSEEDETEREDLVSAQDDEALGMPRRFVGIRGRGAWPRSSEHRTAPFRPPDRR